MSEPFIGEIKAVGFNFAPRGWSTCAGQLVAISQNTALFSLLGTMYGGDGRTNFALPDLQGRTAIGAGMGPGLSNRIQGQRGGREYMALSANELPVHSHSASFSGTSTGTFKLGASSNPADLTSPSDAIPAAAKTVGLSSQDVNAYTAASNQNVQMAENTVNLDLSQTTIQIGNTGAGRFFDVTQPWLCINYVIAMLGLFPSRN